MRPRSESALNSRFQTYKQFKEMKLAAADTPLSVRAALSHRTESKEGLSL